MSLIASLSGAALPQRVADSDRANRETVQQVRAASSIEQAASAAGIGETEEDAQTSDRDADGRRLWEQAGATASGVDLEPASALSVPAAKDPTGARGNFLDVLG